ncbi:MAG: hypothetical protein ACI87E_004632 [Mariniblastus sp.]
MIHNASLRIKDDDVKNQITNLSSTLVTAVSKISVALLFAIASIGSLPDNVQAQGKLGQARANVRKHQPSPPSRPRREESHDDHDDHDDHDHDSQPPVARRNGSRQSSHDHNPNERRRYNRGSRNSGMVFYSPSHTCVEPIVMNVIADHVIYPQVAQRPMGPRGMIYESVVIAQPHPPQTRLAESVVLNSPLDAGLGTSASVSSVSIASEPVTMGDSYFDFGPSKFWATVGSDFDGITTGGLGINLQSENGPGFDTSVMILRESVGGFRDHFWVGDVNLVYEVISSDFLRGRVGLGVNWLSDAWGAEAGFNLTAGLDARLTERLTLSAEADLGNLGDADFFHGRVNLARRFQAFDWIVGADHFDFGGAEVTSYFTGIQFRF